MITRGISTSETASGLSDAPARGAGRQDSANSRTPIVRRIQRQPLSASTQSAVEFIQSRARLDCGDQIGGLVLDYLIQTRGLHD